MAVLAHYTNGIGIAGIINSKVLRLGNVLFMNDAKEQVLARELVISEINQSHITPCRGNKKNWANVLHQYWKPRVCVFSLTEQRDDLAQWRGYAGKYGFGLNLIKICFNK